MDHQKVTVLVLLDLSAAFDTIDINILSSIFQEKFKIGGNVANWFSEYLTDRNQRILFDGVLSTKFSVDYGVPQGSVAGPVTFLSYLSSLYDLIESHLPSVGGFADDNQLYLAFHPRDCEANEAIKEMSACVKSVRKWMLQHRLKINDMKTEIIFLGSKKQLSKLDVNEFTVGNATIKAVNKVCNLGVIFDAELSMKDHISAVCKKGFFQLYRLRNLRRCVDQKTLNTLVHAFVTSHLDYGNSMFYQLPDIQIRRLQLLQNAAARFVTGKKKFDSAKECLKQLHWLPIRARIDFKIALLVFKYKLGILPSYLSELIKDKSCQKTLRSSNKDLLSMPRVKTSFGMRAFTYAAPAVWNNLPEDLKSIRSLDTFKRKLKTHLFRNAFNGI